MITQELTDPETLPGLPRISIGLPPRAIAAQAAAALASTGRVYRRDGAVVEVDVDEHARVHVNAMSADDLDSMLAECVEFYRPERPEWPVPCPRTARRLILSRADRLPLPALAGIAHGAVMRADGTMVTQPGYDADSGYYVEAAVDPIVVPLRPTFDDAMAARAVLDHVLREFRFAGDAHRAGAMAALLTLLARPMIDGYVPWVIASAPAEGCGKTTLLDVIGIIATGESPAHSPRAHSDADFSKLVTALIRGQHPLAVIDNHNGTLDSSALAAAATSERQRTRSMHSHSTHDATVRTLFAIDGINVRPTPEIARRFVAIELRPPAGPKAATEFAIVDILAHVRARRSELASAAYTILRHHVVEGVDGIKLSPWISFAPWSRVVRGALVRVGYADPVEAMRTALDDADMTPALAAALIPWLRRHAEAGRARLQAKDIAEMLLAAEMDAETDALAAIVETALAAERSTSKDGITPTNIGVLLSRIRGMANDGLMLRSWRSQGRHAWGVVPIADGDDGGGSPPATFAASVPSAPTIYADVANDVLASVDDRTTVADATPTADPAACDTTDDDAGGATTISPSMETHESLVEAVVSAANASAMNDTTLPECDDPRAALMPPDW